MSKIYAPVTGRNIKVCKARRYRSGKARQVGFAAYVAAVTAATAKRKAIVAKVIAGTYKPAVTRVEVTDSHLF